MRPLTAPAPGAEAVPLISILPKDEGTTIRRIRESQGSTIVRHQPRRWTTTLTALAMLLGLSVLGEGVVAAAKPLKASSTCYRLDGTSGPATIVLDPGHGGSDPGAINDTYGLIERDLNLVVARRAGELLAATYGYTVALTRYDNATALGNSERGEIANACQAEVFVSVHFNASTDATVNYTQTFWGKRRKDEAFAQHMNAALWPALEYDTGGNLTNLTNGGTWQFATGSLLQATMPSTLVETVFLSNAEEAQRLSQDGARVEQIASAIAGGAAEWVG